MRDHNRSSVSIQGGSLICTHLIKVRISQTRFTQDVTFGALKDFLGRPDRLVADWALDRAEDDCHFGRIGTGSHEIFAADPSGQGFQGSNVAR